MGMLSAFQMQGKTVTFTAAVAAPATVQCKGDGNNQPQTYVISNTGNVGVFITCESTSDLATANAVIPVGGTPIRCFYLPAGGAQITISGPPNAYFTGITASGTAPIYITPGEGL
jgi:hypothetical protein